MKNRYNKIIFLYIFLIISYSINTLFATPTPTPIDGKQEPTPIPNPTPTPFLSPCEQDPCNWAKSVGIDGGAAGGVVCCYAADGSVSYYACVWEEHNYPGGDDVEDCIREHEENHLQDPDLYCKYVGNIWGGRGASRDRDVSECNAYKRELSCLQGKINDCIARGCPQDELDGLLEAYDDAKVNGERFCHETLPDPTIPPTPSPTPSPSPTPIDGKKER